MPLSVSSKLRTEITHIPTLQEGSRGTSVKELQEALNALGYKCGAADGIFGRHTEAAVKSFQRAHHLSADGIVGHHTRAALTSALKPKSPAHHGGTPTLREGSHGSAVKSMQKLLDEHGAHVAQDGDFGPKTLAAVKSFQRAHHLAADGICGPKTWGALHTQFHSKPSPHPSSHPTLREGAKGADVSQLQGLLDQNGAHIAKDGDFGPKTQAAVRSFQSSRGLTVDGIVGPKTWGALISHAKPVHHTPSPVHHGGDATVKIGAHGAAVTKLQKLLDENGAHVGVDGQFGPQTNQAVWNFQYTRGLATDGVVGPQTWKALESHAKAIHELPKNDEPGSAKRMLDIARSYLGYHEGAGNSNMFSHAMGRPSEAWCADFVSYVSNKAGIHHVNTASAQGIANELKAEGRWKGRSNPQPGDAVTFRWDGRTGAWADHVGIVEKVFHQNGQTYIQIISGNSGDQVKRSIYPAYSSVVNGYGRLA